MLVWSGKGVPRYFDNNVEWFHHQRGLHGSVVLAGIRSMLWFGTVACSTGVFAR
jgi:hypothetical protein